MPTTLTPADVSDILDRRNESRRWMQLNYWDEFEDVFRSSKCLSKKIMVKDAAGNEVEDPTRTNVCMPETSLIIRRKTARLTANPPQINYSCENDELAQKLTAWAYQQYDRSGEAQEHRRLVHTGVMFGFGVSKLSWETVEINRKFFKAFVRGGQVSYRDRAGVMGAMGASPDDIEQAVGQLGPDLSDPEVSQAISKLGNLVQIPQQVKKYEGPRVKNIFPGDFFIEPGALSVEQSGWAIENYWESDLWLKKMSKQTYCDPETGDEIPVFDPAAVSELSEMGNWNPNQGSQQPYDLRTRLRSSVLGQTLPLYPTKLLPGKRFDILEQHLRDEYGQMWIHYVGNEKVYLGKKPYPWDLYGKTVYTEFVPLFDILSAIGDSTPRLLRFLQALHNATVGARKDLVNQILRPVMLQKFGEDIADEQIQDRRLMRIIQVRDLNSMKPLIEGNQIPSAINAANEEEAQIMKMFSIAEPNLTNVETGTEANPDSGKTATTAVLAAKAADALTQFELDSLHNYFKVQGEKKLWMLQQNETEEPYEVKQKYYSRVEGLSDRYGKVSAITIDPMEIQEDIEVEPEAMSMLSVDDDIRRNSGMQLLQLASSMPGIIDPRYVAKFVASTIRGIDPDEAVPPPQPPVPPPPKVNVAVAVKWPELPADVQSQMLGGAGVQVTPQIQQELNEAGAVKDLAGVSTMADAADNILSPSASQQHSDSQTNAALDRVPDTNMTRGVNG